MTEINLKPFKSDGCSGGMSWLWRKIFKRPPPWEDVCVRHDQAYHKGGRSGQRLSADINMMLDIIVKGYPNIAVLMFILVRIGGLPILPTSYRWGFGRPYFKSFWYDKGE